MKSLLPLSTPAEQARFEDAAFAAWMKKVDALLVKRVGLDSNDLPDVCYRDMHDDGDSPAQAASAAIRGAREEGMA